MGVFTQIIILIAVLASMIMVLLAIRQLAHYDRFDDAEETKNLKEEVEQDSNILSHNNIFHNLVETEEAEKEKKRKTHNKISKEPFSREE